MRAVGVLVLVALAIASCGGSGSHASDPSGSTLVATTTPMAYVRFHGRNLGTWNKRGGSAAERFDYLYSDEELA